MHSVHSYAKLWRTPNIYKRCTSRLHYIGGRSSPIKKFQNPLHVLVLQSLHPKIHTMTTIQDIIKSIARKYLPFSQATLAWKTPSLPSNEFSISCSIQHLFVNKEQSPDRQKLYLTSWNQQYYLSFPFLLPKDNMSEFGKDKDSKIPRQRKHNFSLSSPI